MNISKRRFLQSTAALFCAPAIVKAESIMKVVMPPVRGVISGFDPVARFEEVDLRRTSDAIQKTIALREDGRVFRKTITLSSSHAYLTPDQISSEMAFQTARKSQEIVRELLYIRNPTVMPDKGLVDYLTGVYWGLNETRS